ncbi:hypothetical protein HZA43_02370 [Candidatus Peregrinibacteria bacterium]|nr:hypothetical protein [Candidatus Peregrinibacteria bacterium]
MPIHQFKCLVCGHEFEQLLLAGHHPEKCLECGHPKVQKLISAPGIIFKGKGFYKTDSRGSAGSKSNKQ